MIILKWVPKQAGCYKVNQLLVAFLWVFCSEGLSAVAVFSSSSRIPWRLSGWLASMARGAEEEEEGGKFTGSGCPRSRGALLRPAASLPCLLAWLGRLCLQHRQVELEMTSCPLLLQFLHPSLEYFFSTIPFQVALQLNVEQHQTVVAELQQQYKFLVAVPRWGWGMFKPRELLQ